MKGVLFFVFAYILITSCAEHDKSNKADSIIASGQMPNIAKDNSNNFYLVYGTGDSIMYCYSSDHGETFSTSSLISVLPKLAASHTRGPQVAVTSNGLVLTACNDSGDIFSYVKSHRANGSKQPGSMIWIQ
jgi:hypothetical protein